MNIKTITSTEGVNEVDFGSNASRFYWFRNIGTTAVHVSGKADIVAGGDGVAELAAGDSVCIETLGGKVYVLGAGKVQIHNTGDKFCPFRNAPANVGGGVMAEGNPVIMDNLQGGVPFSEITVSGDDIVGHDLTVNVSGKNLLPAMSKSTTWSGVTYTVNADGTVTLNGTVEKVGSGVDVVNKIPLKAGVYTLSGCPEGGSGTSFALRVGLGTTNTLYGRDYGNGLKITAETDTVITVTIQSLDIGIVFDDIVFRPQLEIGSTATPYEPYHGSVTAITPDSNPYVIPNDIRQVDGLNNITVSEGEISVTGVKRNAAIKRIWDEIDEIKTAIIVSNGETE